MESHWLYNNELLTEVPSKAFGFVYMITNTITSKMYIGRKYFVSKRRKKVKGKKRRTIVRTETDWSTYTGSSKTLNKDIAKTGKDKFTFEILVLGETRGQVNYLEENIHHKFHVVARDKFYNDCIGPRRFANVRLSEEVFKSINKLKL
jgi:hypothetical protein